jgi:lipopolysaccharide export system protein LptC
MRAFRAASLLPLMLAALLAGLTYWLDHVVQNDTGPRANRRHDPDYFVDHFTVRRFGPDGTLQHTITADRMVHFPDDDSTEVVSPHLVYETVPPTDITARTAWLDSKGKHVRLDDDVRIVRASIGDQPETVITTSVLYVTPDDETASTKAPVVITQGKSVVTGVGLEANNKTEVAVLSGPVHGTILRSKDK